MSKLSEKISQLRDNYDKDKLDESEVSNLPLQQFERWLDEAIKSKQPEPTAMTLATVSSDLKPSTRVLLLKGYDADGLQWFTNYGSRKAEELAGNPHAAMQFHWVSMQRVVRIEGVVSKLSEQASDEYFNTRPLDSRIGAWASPQSQEISSRLTIVQQVAKYALKFGLKPPRPDCWGGYVLRPQRWEFWQGRPSRLHDRIIYELNDSGDWDKKRLAP